MNADEGDWLSAHWQDEAECTCQCAMRMCLGCMKAGRVHASTLHDSRTSRPQQCAAQHVLPVQHVAHPPATAAHRGRSSVLHSMCSLSSTWRTASSTEQQLLRAHVPAIRNMAHTW